MLSLNMQNININKIINNKQSWVLSTIANPQMMSGITDGRHHKMAGITGGMQNYSNGEKDKILLSA